MLARLKAVTTAVSILTLGVLAANLLEGCGSTTTTVRPVASRTVTVTETTSAPAPSRHRAHHHATAAQATGSAASGWVACDANIRVKKPSTTCSFAENVFYEYWKSDRSSSLVAYSPAASKSFDVWCSEGGSGVTCKTDTGASASFSQSSVDSYDAAQANQYAKTHDLGPGTDSGSGAPDTPDETSTNGSSGDCDSNYEGACVPVDQGDVNCDDLSDTNFQSVGSDPDGLDRDGDGIACES